MKNNTWTTWLQTLIGVFLGGLGVWCLQTYIVSKNAKQEFSKQKEMLVIELEQNRQIVQKMQSVYNESFKIEKKWLRQEKLNRNDTVSLFYAPYFEYERTAFDMLKTSGNMRLIEDNIVRTKIMNIYRDLEIRKRDMEWNMNVKKDLFVEKTKPQIQDINGFIRAFNAIINHEEMAKHFAQLDSVIIEVLPQLESLRNNK